MKCARTVIQRLFHRNNDIAMIDDTVSIYINSSFSRRTLIETLN
jgi:hypothetical protein